MVEDILKLEIDMSVVTQENEVLGFFEGIMEFKNIPTEGESNILFDDDIQEIPLEIANCLQQSQVIENLMLFEEPNRQGAIGRCYLSFFYIPSKASNDNFIEYFKNKYDLFFWEY